MVWRLYLGQKAVLRALQLRGGMRIFIPSSQLSQTVHDYVTAYCMKLGLKCREADNSALQA